MNASKSWKGVSVIAIAALAVLTLSGCPSSMSGAAYSRSEARTAMAVQSGYVESERAVQIEGTKTIGHSTRSHALGAIGGAVLGGLGGAAVEEATTQRAGIEITVRLDDGRVVAVTQAADETFNPGERVNIVTAADGTARVAH